MPDATPIPNAILDAMPALGDAELRILLAITRATHQAGSRCVALSLYQLQTLTGIVGRQHVIAAVRRLTTYGMLTAQRQYAPTGNNAPTHYILTLAGSPPASAPPPPPRPRRSAWAQLLDHYGHACAYCGRTDLPLIREHVIPRSAGGMRVVPACPPCNETKGTADWSHRLRAPHVS